jgi:hypothetical protein
LSATGASFTPVIVMVTVAMFELAVPSLAWYVNVSVAEVSDPSCV